MMTEERGKEDRLPMKERNNEGGETKDGEEEEGANEAGDLGALINVWQSVRFRLRQEGKGKSGGNQEDKIIVAKLKVAYLFQV